MVQAALLTGCRYGELAALVVDDFNRDMGPILIRTSKSNKSRYVILDAEGTQFFATVARDLLGHSPMLVHEGVGPWGKSLQHRSMKDAYTAANLPPLTFHELRHTYASRLVMRGVSLMVIAKQLGHSDSRMVEKHYGHLAPSYIAETIRSNFGMMGVVEPNADSNPPTEDSDRPTQAANAAA